MYSDQSGADRNLLDLCAAFYNVQKAGNVDPRGDPHGELKGQNVLTTIGTDRQKILNDFGLASEAELECKIKQINDLLFKARQQRPRPGLDDKILTSWNGLMISGLAVSGMALGEQKYVDRAVKAAAFIKAHMYKDGALIRSVYNDNDNVGNLATPIHGFADDYAFLIRGLLDLYEATLDETHIEWADELQQKQNSLFWDEKGNTCCSQFYVATSLRIKKRFFYFF